MTITEDDLRAAAIDPAAQAARRSTAAALCSAFERVGPYLQEAGAIFGGDRVAGRSPFRNGDDAAVACGLAASTAAALTRGATTLLDADNAYAAAALVRQLVEVQFLVWCFAADTQAATAWLRSSDDERIKRWRPGALRKRAGRSFSDNCYWSHCELGGHLTPVRSRWLLAHDETRRELLWPDLVSHAAHIWEGLNVAAKGCTEFKFDLVESLTKAPAIRLIEALDHWHQMDYCLVNEGSS